MAKSSYSSGMQLSFYYASAALCAILLRSVRSFYDLATTNALPRRLCYLDTVNIGVLVNPLPGSNALLKFGVAILDSRTTSERFHANVIEELRAIFQLVIVPKLYPSADNHGQTQNRVALRLRLAWT